MPLVIEDGTGKQDADSYLSVEDARTLADTRGIVLATDDGVLSQQLARSFDRLLAYEDDFSGVRAFADQSASYPRTAAYRYGSVIADDVVPREVKLAQITVASLIESGQEVWASGVSNIKRDKTDVLETEFFAPGELVSTDSSGNPLLPEVEAILKPLFKPFTPNFFLGR